MTKVGVFINNTHLKKQLEINFHNIKTLSEHFDKIYIIDEKNDYTELLYNRLNGLSNFQNMIFYEKINVFQKINEIIKLIKNEEFNKITFINDNCIYLTPLKNYFEFVDNCNYDIISYTDSTEIFYHMQMNILTFRKNVFHKYENLIEDFSSKKHHDFNLLYLDYLREINQLFKNKGIFCKTAYIESVYKKNIYLENTDHYFYLLENNILPIIDIKLLENLNLKYDHTDFVFKKLPHDFDLNVYKLYDDLKECDDDFLKTHFIEHGQFECRKYKNHETILPAIIYNKLNKIKLINYFDFPENFDFYVYKNQNDDLNKLNKLDLKNHWINYGAYEDRIYN